MQRWQQKIIMARESFVDAFEALEEVVEHVFHVFDHFEEGVLDACRGDVACVPCLRVDGADESGGLLQIPCSIAFDAEACSDDAVDDPGGCLRKDEGA